MILTSSDVPDAAWTCRITLQREFSFDSRKDDDLFGQWRQDQSTTETPFAVVHDKTELEQMIRRAQFATLNPGDDVSKYISGNIDELTARVGFSPNVIKLDIVDRGLPALSFYDLPSIIDMTENTDKESVMKLVENLVRSYVEKERSITHEYHITLLPFHILDQGATPDMARNVEEMHFTPGPWATTLGGVTVALSKLLATEIASR